MFITVSVCGPSCRNTVSPSQLNGEELGHNYVRESDQNPVDIQQQRQDMINFLRLHPPKNPRVSQLREECRTDPGPNSARNSQFSYAAGGLSFSTSSPSISTSTSEQL